MRRPVVCGLEEGPTIRSHRPVFGLGVGCAREQVLPVSLTLFGSRVEISVGVEALGALWVLIVARPLDARTAKFVVGDARVVAGTTSAALVPRLEGLLRVFPLDKGSSIFVAEIHAPRVLQEDVEVVLRITRGPYGGLREVDRAVGVRVCAGLLAPGRGRQDDIGEPGCLCQEDVLDNDEEVFLLQNVPYPVELGKGDGWVRATYPEEVDRALLGVAEDLHGVGGRRPVRDLHQVHVPQVRQFLDVISVVPVPEGWKVAIGARLAGVLRGGLAVELQDAAARTADHTAQQVDVVDLAGRRRRLVGLVDALERGAEEPLRLPDDARGLPDPARLYATDLRRPLRGALCNSPP